MASSRPLALAVALAALLAGGCSGPAGEGPAAAEHPQRAASLLYLKGAVLRRLDLGTGTDRALAHLPSADVRPAPEGALLATVVDASPPAPGEEDFAGRPRVVLVDVHTGRRRSLGPGVAPLWNESGTRLAWLRPGEERSCLGESCSGRAAVDAIEVGSMRSRTLIPPGRWSLLAWAGDALLAAEMDEPSHVVAATGAGGLERVAIPPSEVWGASPRGDWLLRVGPGSLSLVPLSKGLDAGPARPVARGALALAEGSWAPDEASLAVVELRRRPGGLPRSRIVILSVPDAALVPLPGSRGAIGPVVWSPDGREVAFSRPAGRSGERLEAVLCRVEQASCRSLFSWVKDVTLLRLEPAPARS